MWKLINFRKCLEQLNSKTSKLGTLEMCNFVTCQTFVSSSQTCHDVESSQALFLKNKKFVSLSADRGEPGADLGGFGGFGLTSYIGTADVKEIVKY